MSLKSANRGVRCLLEEDQIARFHKMYTAGLCISATPGTPRYCRRSATTDEGHRKRGRGGRRKRDQTAENQQRTVDLARPERTKIKACRGRRKGQRNRESTGGTEYGQWLAGRGCWVVGRVTSRRVDTHPHSAPWCRSRRGTQARPRTLLIATSRHISRHGVGEDVARMCNRGGLVLLPIPREVILGP